MPEADDFWASRSGATAPAATAAPESSDAFWANKFEITPQEYAQRSAKAGLSVGRPVQEQADILKQKGFAPETVKSLSQQYQLEQTKQDLGRFPGQKETILGSMGRQFVEHGIPFRSLLINPEKDVAEAQKRLQEGNPTEADYKTIARAQRRQEEAQGLQQAGIAGEVIGGLRSAPAIVGEFMAGGAVAKGLGIGQAARVSLGGQLASNAGRMAAITPLVPSMYMEQARQKNIENGRPADSWEGLPPALLHSYAQMLVLGQVFRGAATPGVAAGVKSALTKGATGAVEMGLADSATNFADQFIPQAYKISTGAGTFEHLMKGDVGPALRKFAVDALTLSAFAGLHSIADGVEMREANKTALANLEAAAKDMTMLKSAMYSSNAASTHAAELLRNLGRKIATGEPITGEETIAGRPSKLAEAMKPPAAADPYAEFSDQQLRDYAAGPILGMKVGPKTTRAAIIELLKERKNTPETLRAVFAAEAPGVMPSSSVLSDWLKASETGIPTMVPKRVAEAGEKIGVKYEGADTPQAYAAKIREAMKAPGVAPANGAAPPTETPSGPPIVDSGATGEAAEAVNSPKASEKPTDGGKGLSFGRGELLTPAHTMNPAERHALEKYGNAARLSVLDPAGKEIGQATISESGKTLHVPWLGATGLAGGEGRGKQPFGPREVKELARQLADAFPDAEVMSYTPSAGRLRSGETRHVDLVKMREKTQPKAEVAAPEVKFGEPLTATEKQAGLMSGGSPEPDLGKTMPSAEYRTDLPSVGQPDATGAEQPMREFGLKEAETARLREENRLPPIVEGEPVADAAAWGEMLDTLAKDPNADTALINDLTQKMRATTEQENLLLLHRRIALDAEYRRAMGQATLGVAQRMKGEITRAEEDARFARAEQHLAEIDKLDNIIDKTGTETGRSLRSRRLMAREDYSLSTMMARAQNAKGEEPLTREERAEIADLAKQIEDATKELEGISEETEAAKAELARIRVEIKDKKKRFADKLDAFRWANLTTAAKVRRVLSESLDFSRALRTAFDLSAGLRQGALFALGHPIRFVREVVPQGLKAFKSEREFQTQLDSIMQRDNAVNYKRDGLPIMDSEGPITVQEEAFIGRWVDWKPPTLALRGLLEGVKASGRAYSAMLNRIRADHYDMLAATLSKTGKPTAEEGAAIANAVSVFSGRAKLTGSAEKAASLLTKLFFAPRFVVSRFQLLAGQPLYGGTARTRKAIAQEYGRALLGLGGLYLLASLDDDAKITFDPRSSDFGKIRFGNTRLDPLAGLSQASVFVTRLVSGEEKTAKGKLVPLRDQMTYEAKGKVPYGGQTVGDVVLNFLRSKLAPIPGAVGDALAGKNVVGEPTTAASTAGHLVVPMSVGDVYKSLEDQGVPRGAIIGLLSILGMGAQTYEPNKKGAKETTLEQLLR